TSKGVWPFFARKAGPTGTSGSTCGRTGPPVWTTLPMDERNDLGAEYFHALQHRSEAGQHDVDADLLIATQALRQPLRRSNEACPQRIAHAVARPGVVLGLIGKAFGLRLRRAADDLRIDRVAQLAPMSRGELVHGLHVERHPLDIRFEIAIAGLVLGEPDVAV